MLYERYLHLIDKKKIVTGFSRRLPDYATQFWFDHLEQVVHQSSKKRFLDIGAGSGRLSVLLSSFFESGTALEIDIDQEQWKTVLNTYKNIELYEGLLQEIVPALSRQNHFDLIIMAEVFEHIPLGDISDFLKIVKNLLSHDGRIFLTTPNAITQGPAETSSLWHEKQPWGHHKHYTYKELKKILWDHGFEIESCSFECNKVKKNVYNKLYYPTARLDNKLMSSKKIPHFLRRVYTSCSWPFIVAGRTLFWSIAKFLRSYEQRYNNEQNSLTMIIVARKRDL